MRLAAAGIVLALTACTTTEHKIPVTAEDLPPRFLAAPAGTGPIAEQWWTRFGDPRLDQLVNEAVLENTSVAQAVARVRIAQAQARIAGADLLPQVSGGLTARRQRQPASGVAGLGQLPGLPDGAEAPDAFTITNYAATVDVNWELDLWGRISAQNAAARADFLASTENLRAVRQSIAAQAVRMYFTVVEARAQVELAERTVETVGEVARQINNRANVGIATPSDRLLANANLDQARSLLEQRREALATLTRQFEVLLRDYPAGSIATAETLPEVPPPPSTGIPSEILLRRPDIAAAERSLQAAGFRLTAGQRSFLPNLSLTGSAGLASSDLGDLLDGGSFIWSIAGALLQPIFQGGRLRAQVQALEGRREEAVEVYAETVLNALLEVETALAVERYLAQRELALDSAASAAEGAVQIAFNRYREGIDPLLTVLESQQRALDSRSAYIAARRARLDNRINLHLALGGGFEDMPISGGG
ncbi:MAG TPA: efflux transporter outer membrane subunit [Croceibacterium sp.]|nr:efflux transporter outer membrane subunit [Croceibacterium sp.]